MVRGMDTALHDVKSEKVSAKSPPKWKVPPKCSPINGQPVPSGRRKGIPNKVTQTIRDAVELAAKQCHPQGLAGWLVERAQGGVQDRQIFAGLVAKALPLQVKASVDGGIAINLGWLAGRGVGAITSQSQPAITQVIDVTPETDNANRIDNQVPVSAEVVDEHTIRLNALQRVDDEVRLPTHQPDATDATACDLSNSRAIGNGHPPPSGPPTPHQPDGGGVCELEPPPSSRQFQK